jgi:ferredoxin-NADP reductase
MQASNSASGEFNWGSLFSPEGLVDFCQDSKATYLVCGPPPFTDEIQALLCSAGVRPDRISVL